MGLATTSSCPEGSRHGLFHLGPDRCTSRPGLLVPDAATITKPVIPSAKHVQPPLLCPQRFGHSMSHVSFTRERHI